MVGESTGGMFASGAGGSSLGAGGASGIGAGGGASGCCPVSGSIGWSSPSGSGLSSGVSGMKRRWSVSSESDPLWSSIMKVVVPVHL